MGNYADRAEKAKKSGKAKRVQAEVEILDEVGMSITGKFVGTKEIKTNTKEGSSTAYEFETDDGNVLLLCGAYGRTILNQKGLIGKVLSITRTEDIVDKNNVSCKQYEIVEV